MVAELTDEEAITALLSAAQRLGRETLTRGDYRQARQQLLAARQRRHTHGRLRLPNENQIARRLGG